MPQASSVSGDDYASNDEVKVYKDEGENEDEKRSENLNEEKLGLVTETEEVGGVVWLMGWFGWMVLWDGLVGWFGWMDV